MAEPGIPHQLKGKAFGIVMQDACVKFANAENQVLYQRFKCFIGHFIFCFVGVIPFAVVIV